MHDIRLAVGLIAFISIGLFLGSLRLLRNRPLWVHDTVAVATLILLALYVKFVWGQLWIVEYIPLPSVLVLSNWFPPLLAVLAAATWLRLDPLAIWEFQASPEEKGAIRNEALFDSEGIHWGGLLRRLPVMAVLVAGAIYSVLHFIPKEPPVCDNVWQRPLAPMVFPVCRQTTPHTCSAAASATLLLTLGLETSEQEMAELCLTKSGTTWLGLYHGLATKLFATGYHVKFFKTSTAELPNVNPGRVSLLCCQLADETASRNPKYEQQGWLVGTAHTVAYFGKQNGFHFVGDPSVGYEAWTDEDMTALWTGQGLMITGEPYQD